MRLHYNSECTTHNESPTARMRLLFLTGKYEEVLEEIDRLDAVELEPPLRLVVRTHWVVTMLALHRGTYELAKRRLVILDREIAEQSDENHLAEFRSRCISLSARFGDHDLADNLTNNFFSGINRTPITEANWRIGQGRRYQHQKGPAAAIPLFQTVVMQLGHVHRPCLREMAARHMAVCLNDLDAKRDAILLLRNLGLPASDQPGEGEVPLKELLVVTAM